MATTKKTAQPKSKTVKRTSIPSGSSLPMNRNTKIVIVIGLILAGLYYARGLFVVALVNGQPITRYEVIHELERQAGQATTDALISEKLIYNQAKEQGITIEQSAIDKRIKDIEDDLATTGQNLDELLELQGVTRQEVEDQTRLQLILRELLADKIAVTDEEVDDVFEQQLEVKPEDLSEEEFRAQIKSSIEEQKFSFEAQSFVQELQNGARIQYWLEY